MYQLVFTYLFSVITDAIRLCSSKEYAVFIQVKHPLTKVENMKKRAKNVYLRRVASEDSEEITNFSIATQNLISIHSLYGIPFHIWSCRSAWGPEAGMIYLS